MSYCSKIDERKNEITHPMCHYVNGVFTSENDACISIFDSGLLRGHGVFDYAEVYEGRPFHLMDHLLRLKWSCEQIELSLPTPLHEIADLVKTLIEKNEIINGGIRFIITGGNVSQDLLLPGEKANLMILCHPFVPLPDWYHSKGVRTVTTNMLRLMPSVKMLSYMPAIFAMKKAKERNFDDALYLNSKQEILEGTTCNAFFFKEGTWITSDSDELIKGITRSILIDLIKKDYPLEYRSVHLSEVESCEEAFLCSSVKDAVPLVQIDDYIIGSGMPGQHTARIRDAFREYIKNYLREV